MSLMAEMGDLVVLTCASGKQCSHIIPLVNDKGVRLRLVVNSDSSLKRLQEQYPSAEVVQADLAILDECRRILNGATTVYHIGKTALECPLRPETARLTCVHPGPSLHPFETPIGLNMIDAAVEEQAKRPSNFRHFILSSALWSQLNKMMHHEAKRGIEQYLIESPLQWTILSPTHFIDILPVAMLAGQEKPVYPLLWNADTLMSFVTLADIGEASAKVIAQGEKHFYAQYSIVSTQTVRYGEVLEEIGRQIGREIEMKKVPYEEACDMFLKRAYGDKVHPATRAAAERMILFYQTCGLVGNTNVTQWLLGHETMGYKAWIQSQLKAASAS